MYARRADIERRRIPPQELLRLTDDGGVDAVVSEAIAVASSEIDAMLMHRYRVPITPVPELLRQICVDIASLMIWQRRSGEVPETILYAANWARKMLQKIAKGEVHLESVQSIASLTVWSRERVFKGNEGSKVG